MNGNIYFGVLHGVDVVHGRLSVALRMAHLKPRPANDGVLHACVLCVCFVLCSLSSRGDRMSIVECERILTWLTWLQMV